MGAVTFDYTKFITRYQVFAGMDPETAQAYFDEATLYCANRLDVVSDPDKLLMLLNMLTAHIAALNDPNFGLTDGASSIGRPPGRVSQATEGSVSVSFENQYEPGTAQWYQQTTYGSAYWAATKIYRTFQYRRGRGNPPLCPPGVPRWKLGC